MDILESLGNPGYVLALICAAFGSALGTSAAGMAALGAWKKCFLQNKKRPIYPCCFCGGSAFTNNLWNDPDECY